jgi:hypothetical protein
MHKLLASYAQEFRWPAAGSLWVGVAHVVVLFKAHRPQQLLVNDLVAVLRGASSAAKARHAQSALQQHR